MLRLAAFLVLTYASLLAQHSNRYGVIRGVVLDATGSPVAAAKVKANFTGGFDAIVPSSLTDNSGKFEIPDVMWGKWYVTASKEQDGYPDQSIGFYGLISNPLIVALDSEHPQQTVTVHLGRRAGSIFGTVVDAKTGKPVEPCAELRWKHAPLYWGGYGVLKSRFRLLVPADTDITLTVWASGYEPWFYKAKNGQDSLRVHADYELNIPIQLTPTSNKAEQPTDEKFKNMGVSLYGCGDPAPKP